jgi:hypothetical protein
MAMTLGVTRDKEFCTSENSCRSPFNPILWPDLICIYCLVTCPLNAGFFYPLHLFKQFHRSSATFRPVQSKPWGAHLCGKQSKYHQTHTRSQ